jgi:hypothetical protein
VIKSQPEWILESILETLPERVDTRIVRHVVVVTDLGVIGKGFESGKSTRIVEYNCLGSVLNFHNAFKLFRFL